MNSQALPVYLLAGGLSSRFGSDKALAELGGRPLILRLAALLQPYATEIKVVSDRADKYAALGLPTLADRLPQAGPMGGLYTALHDLSQSPGEWLLLASCDLWGFTPDQIEMLLAAPRHGVQTVAWRDSHWQPLWALYHRDLLPELEHRLAQHQGALWRLLEAIPVRRLDASNLGWIQINRPVDLERANRGFPGQDLELGPQA